MKRHYLLSLLAVALAGTVPVAAAPDAPTACTELVPTAPENGRVKQLFETMREGKYKDHHFPKLTWQDIPALLERADSTVVLRTFPYSLESSQRQDQCSEGMVALWLVEGIRKGGRHPSLNPLCLPRALTKRDWNKVSEELHAEVARAYRAWWKQADKLGWFEGRAIDPLQDAKFHWH